MHWRVTSRSIAHKYMTVRIFRFPANPAVITPKVMNTVNIRRFLFLLVICLIMFIIWIDSGVSPISWWISLSGLTKSSRSKRETMVSPDTYIAPIHGRFSRWHSPSFRNPLYWTLLFGNQKKHKCGTIDAILVMTIRSTNFLPLHLIVFTNLLFA